MARPSKFPVGQEKVLKALYLKGCTDGEVAEAFGVAEQTVNNWKLKRPKFFESLKDWKLQADTEVEKALRNRAIGAKVTEQRLVFGDGDAEVVETTKEYPPDTAACVVWLANRQPEKWKKDPGESAGTAQQIADALSQLANNLPA